MILDHFSKLLKTIREHTGTFSKLFIVLLTTGIEQLISVAVYKCPCEDSTSIDPSCPTTTYSFACTKELNRWYGLVFIFIPALVLFIFSISASPKFWKIITGRCYKLEAFKKSELETAWTLLKICCKALIAPSTWVCIALLDGRYLACAITPLPYADLESGCEKLANLADPKKSIGFNEAKAFSRVIGAMTIGVLLLVGFALYLWQECSFPLTYYHAKFYHLYRNKEEEEMEEQMINQAEKEAKQYVKKFLEKKRETEFWDQISTVFTFKRNENNLVLYSPLHQLVQGGFKSRKSVNLENGLSEEVEDQINCSNKMALQEL